MTHCAVGAAGGRCSLFLAVYLFKSDAKQQRKPWKPVQDFIVLSRTKSDHEYIQMLSINQSNQQDSVYFLYVNFLFSPTV